ncbi:MAG: hypothetical protein PF961_07855 [Planctomycetota bacterium]|jgi:alpha-galactosidase|nr:hypothetical protein [Planctomycetota bacterium]
MDTCFARHEGDEIHIGNAVIERRWRVQGGNLVPLSLRVAGCEWIGGGDEPGTVPPQGDPSARVVSFTTEQGKALPVAAPSLRAELVVRGEREQRYRFTVYPGVAAVGVQLCAPGRGAAAALAAGEGPSGVEQDPVPSAVADEPLADLCESFHLAMRHCELTQVVLQDRTDVHDTLAAEHAWHSSVAEHIQVQGIVFGIENPLTRSGLVLIKQAPLPAVRPVPDPVDLSLHNTRLRLHGHGIGDGDTGYAWVVIGYEGGRLGRQRAVQRWQRQLRVYQPGLDGVFLTNTWGDRNRDGRINEPFLVSEVAATAALGADLQQIDDGWQRGITANSVNSAQGGVWIGFYAADPKFWDVNIERLPNGIGPIVDATRAAGIGLGLWFAPDSADDFANWERDVAVIEGYYREHGIRWVKIDGVKVHSKVAEANLRRFFHGVLERTQGQVVFDQDVTAEVRPGYFGLPEAGPLFVENRYSDWAKYWPHATLRNLWQLSWWVDPVRLRMEFLNNERNVDKYGDDPLAPVRYGADYLFASVMMAAPLGWFETSGLSGGFIAAVAPLVALWRQHRAVMHGGAITPVGSCPNGASWTGLCSVGADEAHLVVFRECNDHSEADLQVPLDWDGVVCERLAGNGTLELTAGIASLHIDAPMQFAWWRITRS